MCPMFQVVGRSLDLHGMPVEIVGVLESGAELPTEPGAPNVEGQDVWLPLSTVDSRFTPEGPFYPNHSTPMIARLAPGVSPEQVQAGLDRMTTRLP